MAVVTLISADDDMYLGGFSVDEAALRADDLSRHYFSVGRGLTAYVSANASSFCGRLLEVPCGHGRVTRHLVDAFPNAEIWAADVLPSAVAFQVATFGTKGILIEPPYLDYKELPDGSFGCVVVGSLITHLDEESARTIFAQVTAKMQPDAILVITTHGARSAEILRVKNPYHINDADAATLLSAYAAEGFGYAPYARTHTQEKNTTDFVGDTYGVSLMHRRWVETTASEAGLTIVSYQAGGWDDHQDVFVFAKRR